MGKIGLEERKGLAGIGYGKERGLSRIRSDLYVFIYHAREGREGCWVKLLV
jgi:hypothetical protein